MVEANLYSFDGNGQTESIELEESIFDGTVNADLLYRAVRMQLSNRRQGTSSTKGRGEARGGGRKPWRQKGTGRARAGSRRSPLWVGGGVVFGPKPRTYKIKLTKKMRRRALNSALTDRAQDGSIAVVDRVMFEVPKTKAALSLLERLEAQGSTLVVVSADEYTNSVRKSFSNIPQAKCLACVGLNTYDILRHERLVFTLGALEELKERF